MSKEEKFGITCKILFLGESNVGKNCIVNRFANNIFDYNKYTISGAYKINKNMFIKDINKLINFEIWITPGQKKYRIMHRVLYNNTNIFILVYDITNYSSFDEIKKYWMNEIKLRASKNSSTLYKF
jgi:small GTP-binding protein